MRLVTSMLCIACTFLAGCATESRTWADDRPTIGVQPPTPVCSSGPNGKTAACAATVGINAAIQAAQK